MTTRYTTKTGRIQYKPHEGWLMEVINGSNDMGFCLACAEEVDGVEPDAERDHCPSCYEQKVYGAEQLMLMGLFYNADDIENQAAITAHNRTTVK